MVNGSVGSRSSRRGATSVDDGSTTLLHSRNESFTNPLLVVDHLRGRLACTEKKRLEVLKLNPMQEKKKKDVTDKREGSKLQSTNKVTVKLK